MTIKLNPPSFFINLVCTSICGSIYSILSWLWLQFQYPIIKIQITIYIIHQHFLILTNNLIIIFSSPHLPFLYVPSFLFFSQNINPPFLFSHLISHFYSPSPPWKLSPPEEAIVTAPVVTAYDAAKNEALTSCGRISLWFFLISATAPLKGSLMVSVATPNPAGSWPSWALPAPANPPFLILLQVSFFPPSFF